MRDRYWQAFLNLKFKENYYIQYKESSRTRYIVISVTALIVSISGLTIWFEMGQFRFLLTATIIIGQVLAIITVFLPYTQQSVALTYLLPDLSRVLLAMERDWDGIEWVDDERIKTLLHKHQSDFNKLVQNYTNGVSFQQRSGCVRRASIEAQRYLQAFYTEEGE
jgi:hypothetical protein